MDPPDVDEEALAALYEALAATEYFTRRHFFGLDPLEPAAPAA